MACTHLAQRCWQALTNSPGLLAFHTSKGSQFLLLVQTILIRCITNNKGITQEAAVPAFLKVNIAGTVSCVMGKNPYPLFLPLTHYLPSNLSRSFPTPDVL